MEKLLPWIMCGISVAASLVYFSIGDWKHGGYWASAAAITFFVTV